MKHGTTIVMIGTLSQPTEKLEFFYNIILQFLQIALTVYNILL